MNSIDYSIQEEGESELTERKQRRNGRGRFTSWAQILGKNLKTVISIENFTLEAGKLSISITQAAAVKSKKHNFYFELEVVLQKGLVKWKVGRSDADFFELHNKLVNNYAKDIQFPEQIKRLILASTTPMRVSQAILRSSGTLVALQNKADDLLQKGIEGVKDVMLEYCKEIVKCPEIVSSPVFKDFLDPTVQPSAWFLARVSELRCSFQVREKLKYCCIFGGYVFLYKGPSSAKPQTIIDLSCAKAELIQRPDLSYVVKIFEDKGKKIHELICKGETHAIEWVIGCRKTRMKNTAPTKDLAKFAKIASSDKNYPDMPSDPKRKVTQAMSVVQHELRQRDMTFKYEDSEADVLLTTEDLETNVKYGSDKKLEGATKLKLIEKLCLGDISKTTFLFTFPIFCEPLEVIEQLSLRLRAAPVLKKDNRASTTIDINESMILNSKTSSSILAYKELSTKSTGAIDITTNADFSTLSLSKTPGNRPRKEGRSTMNRVKSLNAITSDKLSDFQFSTSKSQLFLVESNQSPKVEENSSLVTVGDAIPQTEQIPKNDNTALVTVHILEFLLKWIQLVPQDFRDRKIYDAICDFKLPQRDDIRNTVERYRQILDQNLSGEKNQVTFIKPPEPNLPTLLGPGNFETFDLAAEEISRQISLVAGAIWSKISPREFLYWNSKEQEKNAPNLLKLVNHFNNISSWAGTYILTGTTPKQRAYFIMHIVDVAIESYKMQNYHTTVSILTALSSAPISRLKKSWRLIDPKTDQRLQYIRDIFSAPGNWKKYREHIQACKPPCVPFVGVYLQDITFIDDGNRSTLEPHNLLNWVKCKLFGSVILELEKFQHVDYLFTPVPLVQDYLQNGKYLSEKELWQISCKVEPKENVASKK